jgi:Flp pilus assembly protein TadD
MKTLYDLLGARAGDDAEAIKKAFRKAVKATHPDLHGGDADALVRFRQIVNANAILSDAKQRATYDLLLQRERQFLLRRQHQQLLHRESQQLPQLEGRRLRPKRTHTIIFRAAAVIVVCVAPIVGYELFASVSTTAVEAVKKVEDTATAVEGNGQIKDAATAVETVKVDVDSTAGRAETTAVQPASRVKTAARDGPTDKDEDTEVPNQAIESSAAAPPMNSDAALATNSEGAEVIADHEPGPGALSNDAKFYREQGINSYRKGDFPRAIIDFDKAIRLDPNDAQAYNLRGNAWDEIGAFELALADYEHAIRIDPNSPAVFHDRAILWQRKGALDRALVDLDRAIRFSFSDANIYSDRGLVWYEKGRYDRAVADFNRAVKLDPNFASAYISRGVILHRRTEFNLAFAAMHPAIHVDPHIFDVARQTK